MKIIFICSIKTYLAGCWLFYATNRPIKFMKMVDKIVDPLRNSWIDPYWMAWHHKTADPSKLERKQTLPNNRIVKQISIFSTRRKIPFVRNIVNRLKNNIFYVMVTLEIISLRNLTQQGLSKLKIRNYESVCVWRVLVYKLIDLIWHIKGSRYMGPRERLRFLQ